MAEEFPRQTFQIADLPTKSVTLYPARAHIIRELRDIVLQPGQNEIEIMGLTPSMDENSVQVDGKGSATITDMTLELVPNPAIFSESYPSDSEDSEDESDDDEDSDDEIESVKAMNTRIEKTDEEIAGAVERQKSAERRLKTLDSHADGINGDKWSAEKVADALRIYDEERRKLFEINRQALSALKKLRASKTKMESERSKLGKDEEKRRLKVAKEKEKAALKLMRKRQERRKEAQRIKNEHFKFWPKHVYCVVLRLEGTSINTPGSSRRNSMDSITLSGAVNADSDKQLVSRETATGRTVTLSLSYVTSSAFWSPRYDLSISSLNKTTTIVYRAEFSNGTSETWKDAKLILSTSQTSYSGLDDKPPFLHGWQVKLIRGSDNGTGGLLSTEELTGFRYQAAMTHQANRRQFAPGGITQSSVWANNNNLASNVHLNAGGGLFGNSQPQRPQMPPQMQAPGVVFGGKQQAPQIQQQQQNQARALQTSYAPQSSGFGTSTVNSSSLFGSSGERDMSKKKKSGGLFGGADDAKESQTWQPSMDHDEEGGSTVPRGEDDVDFEESVWEDYGLTATYEIPGTRTLSPSSLARRHKIASLNATNIHLSYVAVPKLRAAAFLRAKVRNPSATVTLLKGTAGVTLDGSFLGNMTLPRVSPNQVFSLPLGADPAIHVSYPKPTVHRSTMGIFNKESAHVFTRTVWLTNTKPTPVEILIMDQVPVSQDERLRIDIAHPKGLNKEGNAVKTGQAAKEGPSGTQAVSASTAWGKATAAMKKAGEINWTVNLEKGQACLLKLEYEARMPSAEIIVGA